MRGTCSSADFEYEGSASRLLGHTHGSGVGNEKDRVFISAFLLSDASG